MAFSLVRQWQVPNVALSQKLGRCVANAVAPASLITLRGDLGAGKTSFSKGFISAHTGIDADDVVSPTFNLAIEYDEAQTKVVHVDAYRLTDPEALTDLGFDDWLNVEDAIVLLEWPEKVEECLPEERLEFQITHQPNGRLFKLLASENNLSLATQIADLISETLKEPEQDMAEAVTQIILNGAPGRMAQQIATAISSHASAELQAVLCRPSSSSNGKALGELSGFPNLDINVVAEVDESIDLEASVMVDFSSPEGCLNRLEFAIENEIPFLTGTTGLTDEELTELKRAGTAIPVLYASNTSLGVNVMRSIVRKLASLLDDDYDVEVVESHHKWKKDSPSGTAISLVEEIEAGRASSNQRCYGREGRDLSRPRGEIGIHALRMGDVVGEHTVFFTAEGERIEIKHTAHSRATFAHGAIKAALWLAKQPAGFYEMSSMFKDAKED